MQPATSAAADGHGVDASVRMRPLRPGRTLPLVVEPGRARTVDALCRWMGEHRDEVRHRLTERGAILFRGFPVNDADAFERVVRTIDDDLKNDYLGTSPRDALTDYVFSASELSGFYVIPQHCEMTFVAHPPRRLFFCCLLPARYGGETPLIDARRVLEQIDPDVLRRFEERGLRITRSYDGPDAPERSLDPWKLKRWDQMFQTNDRARVEARASEEGFDVEWTDGGGLRLVHTQPAVQRHPETDEPAWFNHLVVFHASTGPSELRRAWELRHDPRDWLLSRFGSIAVTLRQRLVRGGLPLQCTYADGAEIPLADVEHVRDVVWRNLVLFPWRAGDVLAIDNRAASHGRMPYYGPRQVAVCWS